MSSGINIFGLGNLGALDETEADFVEERAGETFRALPGGTEPVLGVGCSGAGLDFGGSTGA